MQKELVVKIKKVKVYVTFDSKAAISSEQNLQIKQMNKISEW